MFELGKLAPPMLYCGILLTLLEPWLPPPEQLARMPSTQSPLYFQVISQARFNIPDMSMSLSFYE